MSWILQRGPGSTWTEASDILLAWTEPRPELRAGARMIFVNPAGEVWSTLSGSLEELSREKRGSHELCQVDGEIKLILWRKPWWESIGAEDLGTEGIRLLLPFQGWSEDVWYDGPLLALAGGEVLGAVAPGPAGRLRCDLPRPRESPGAAAALSVPELLDNLSAERGHILKLSLVQALLQRAPPELKNPGPVAFALSMVAWTAQTAGLLLLLRAAFPERAFYLDGATELPSAGWKRYCQNLDIQPPRRAREAAEIKTLRLLDLWPRAEPEVFHEFLLAYQKRVPVLPTQLLASFGHSH